MNTRKQSVTSSDVARHAGVSQSAVSLVISGKAGTRVSAATAERIRQSAAELGYSPNHAASILRTGVVPTLALAVPTVEQPFFSSVLVAAERQARQSGYSMILLDSGGDERWATRMLDMLRGGMLAGAIAYAPTDSETELLVRSKMPIVLADVEGAGLPTVRFDVSAGARAAAEHLADLGHTYIGYLGASATRATYRFRQAAFIEAAEARGSSVVAVEHSTTLELDDALNTARRLLDSHPRITAVMCDDDLLAAAIILAAGPGRVPQDLSVIGFGNIDLARMITPALTTVDLSSATIGARAVDLLLMDPAMSPRPQDDDLPSRLIIRRSTSQAPRRDN